MVALKLFSVFLVILFVSEISTKRTGSGGRRTSSSSSSGWGWSRPKSNPKPQTNYGQTSQTNVDNKRLSYGSDTAPKPSAPVDSRPAGTNIGWNAPNNNQQPKNVGWNVGQNPSPGDAAKPNIGWNVPKTQGGYNQPKPGQIPPSYSSSGTNPSYSSGAHNPPPPYPGLGNTHHSSVGNAPPPYSGYGGHNQPPPAYPGQTNNRFGGSNYPQQNNYGHNTYGQQNSYGQNPYGQQNQWGTPGFGNPGYGGGYNRGGFGGGGFGGGGFGGGGFGGGGFGGGMNPYGYQKSRSSFGLGSVASHVGTFVAGAMLWNMASNLGRSNYQVYHNAPRQTYRDSDGKVHEFNVTHDLQTPNEAKMSIDYGNMTCITIYNSQKFAKWANRTIQQVEYETKQAFPFANLANLQNGTQSGQVQFNFTIEPGKIIHNETVSITCCGTDNIALDFEDLLSGKDPTANCVHLAAKIPFRAVKVLPLNVTVNITNKDLEVLANATLTNSTEINTNTTMEPIVSPLTVGNVTQVNLTSVETTSVNVTVEDVTPQAAILNETTTASNIETTTVTI